MKKQFFIFILLFLFSVNISAQNKTDDLNKLLKLMRLETMIDAQLKEMIPIFKHQAREQIQGNDAEQKIDQYLSYMMDEMKNITERLVQEDVANVYDKHFTDEEIKDLIAFYESPTGQKSLDKTPEITADMMTLMMTKYMPELQERLRTRLEKTKD